MYQTLDKISLQAKKQKHISDFLEKLKNFEKLFLKFLVGITWVHWEEME